jgi:phage-related baseplate assembly protein
MNGLTRREAKAAAYKAAIEIATGLALTEVAADFGLMRHSYLPADAQEEAERGIITFDPESDAALRRRLLATAEACGFLPPEPATPMPVRERRIEHFELRVTLTAPPAASQ